MRSKFVAVTAVALLGAFLYVLMRIALLPLESGETYPAYSTLRADPRGAKALYESLAALGELRVSRNFQPQAKLKGTATAIFFLGDSVWSADVWSEDQLKFFESLASEGARVVIAFLPEPPQSVTRKRVLKADSQPAIVKRWHIVIDAYEGSAEDIEAAGSLPRETNAFFDQQDGSEWEVLDVNDEEDPTLIVHDFGKGQIVMLTESYPLSNEGLRAERDTELIQMLGGSYRELVFDESHLGVASTGSVGALIRRYRLTGVFAVALSIGLLFLWKNASSLLPQAEEPVAAVAQGADAQSGLVNLLKRSVPANSLARACWDRWNETRLLGRPVSGERIRVAERELAGSGPARDVYKKIQHILTEKT